MKTLEDLPHADASYRSALNSKKGFLLPGTRIELLKSLMEWATDSKKSQSPIYILSGAAGATKGRIVFLHAHDSRQAPLNRNRKINNCLRVRETSRRERTTWRNVLLHQRSHRSKLHASGLQHNRLSACSPSVNTPSSYSCRNKVSSYE